MYPARFRYEAPKSLPDALDLLRTYGDEAKVLAGGQSLIPMVKLRFATPELLVDINNLPDLGYHDVRDGALEVGALCRHVDLEFSTGLGSWPLMESAAPLIADPIVRNRGTLVGSLCHADPQGDWASVLLALNGEVVAASATGRRTVPMSEFVTGPFQNALLPGEVAVAARVPAPTGTPYGRYLKLERRVGDFATVGVAVALQTTGGTVTSAGIALTGVGANNIKATAAERVLTGHPLEPDVVAEAARLAAEAARPRTDHRGSADYKRHVVETFVSRALGSSVTVAA
ncbi:FAD binding domain-containing protein [Actinophytocola oryzae]|uniref:Carbon-monoxide dehydrogenase medium subunit n=1 Tax=Actinophytocola oryzae TaxID=502181 RepID=A0A4R7VR16_9PSEU|nr:xanthine dehydrogenase family protein subunit M [Actinophytocola oryzae]TDV52134.1 carbon-monoxide dehydrogenase medium subunit [Actinophytocola oryzae]